MAERLGVPVVVDNDANAALIAEHRRGAARGRADGGAADARDRDRRRHRRRRARCCRGARGGAGEWGHMVVDIDGPPCPCDCPNRGCLEMLVSGTALGREARGAPPRSCRTRASDVR